MQQQAPQPIDTLFQSYGRTLYKITGTEEEDDILQQLSSTPSADNSSSVQTSASDIGSGVSSATVVQATGSIQQGKQTFDNTVEGFILGTDPKVGLAKFYIGDASEYLNWDGTNLVTNGNITGGSLTIGNNAFIDSNGNATFIGISSLNKKAYTNFESSGRFISSTGGSGGNSFGNQGVTISPGATGTSFSRLLWDIAYVFTNNPTFTATVLANSLHAATNTAEAFIGLGAPVVAGAGITLDDVHGMVGFFFQKTSGVVTILAYQQKGDSTAHAATAMTTISDSDSVELYLHMGSTGVNYYFRKNGGALSAATFLSSATMPPSNDSDQYVCFATTNTATATDFSIIVQCAAYEH